MTSENKVGMNLIPKIPFVNFGFKFSNLEYLLLLGHPAYLITASGRFKLEPLSELSTNVPKDAICRH